MTDPLVPNYNKDVGRLATDRFDFQKHIDGVSFKHTGGAIDLFPTVVISGDTATTVQDAINKIAIALNTPIPDATVSQKGILQLTGDLGGTAAVPRVIGLRGYPVNTNPPSISDILTWDGSSWGPSAPPVTFTAGGDLTGTNTSQTVVALQNRPVLSTAPTTGQALLWDGSSWSPGSIPSSFTAGGDLTGSSTNQQVTNLSGNGTYVTMTASQFIIRDGISPLITQVGASFTDGYNLAITGQSTSASNKNGGTVLITGGQRAPASNTNLEGGVALRIGTTTPSYMVHAAMPQRSFAFPTNRVLGLVTNTALTSSQMGSQTGDLVIYIGNAAMNPIFAPSSGTVVYSSSGKLHVRQSDNTDITVGEAPNPNIWGTVVRGSIGGTDGQVYEKRNIQSTVGATGATFTFPIAVPDHTAVYFDVKIVGKQDSSSTNMAWFHLSAGFSREGTLTQATVRDNNTDGYLPFGAANPYIEHARYTSGAFSWTTKPTIGTSGNNLTVVTGGNASTTITWFIVAKMIIGPSYSNP